VFSVEVAGDQDRQSLAETGQVHNDDWAGRRKLSRKDFHWFAVHCDLNGSSL
jgi:hypothetical protein